MHKLQYFPIAFFSMIMGLGGFAIAIKQGEEYLPLPFQVSYIVLIITTIIFIILLFTYICKILFFQQAVKAELSHPIKLNFFPTISISFIILSIGFYPYHPEISKILWFIGVIGHFIFTLYVMSIWIHHTHFEIHHMNPAWFIPVVGNILVAIVGVYHFNIELSWFFFSIGLLFWLVLLTIVFNRVIFHHPLPENLLPTFFILLAPPSVGVLSYIHLTGILETGVIDSFARVLYYSGLFLGILLLIQISRFTRLPFFLSWWAYSFPVAALTIATFTFYKLTHALFLCITAWFLLIMLTILIFILIFKTLQALFTGKILVKEHA